MILDLLYLTAGLVATGVAFWSIEPDFEDLEDLAGCIFFSLIVGVVWPVALALFLVATTVRAVHRRATAGRRSDCPHLAHRHIGRDGDAQLWSCTRCREIKRETDR